MQIIVKGHASHQNLLLKINTEDLQMQLMDFLKKNHLPIASSCRGEGLCKMCVVNEKILSCSITVEKFMQVVGDEVIVSYL